MIAKIVNKIAEEILTLANLILEDDNISKNVKINKNTLRDSSLRNNIVSKIESLDEPIVINTLFDNYINFIEWDRPKEYGKQPPIDSLRNWAMSRGIPTDNSTLFIISRAIWRDGHKGRPIIATLEKEIEKSFEDGIFEELFEAIIKELTDYFN